MKRLDADTVFSIFESGYEKEEDTLDPFSHPYILMGLIIAGVSTFETIARNYQDLYPDQFKNIHKKVKLLYYDRLYGFLQNIDPSLPLHLLECTKHDLGKIILTLTILLKEYESQEEYTRCAKIKRLLDEIVAF